MAAGGVPRPSGGFTGSADAILSLSIHLRRAIVAYYLQPPTQPPPGGTSPPSPLVWGVPSICIASPRLPPSACPRGCQLGTLQSACQQEACQPYQCNMRAIATKGRARRASGASPPSEPSQHCGKNETHEGNRCGPGRAVCWSDQTANLPIPYRISGVFALQPSCQ